MTGFTRTALAGSSFLALITAGAAFARDASETDASMGDIIVTAQFRAQNLQDTPIAITAVTSELLEARSQTDLAAVASQAPNVVLRPLGGGFGPAMGASIRGIGQFDFNPAMEPGVGIYIDDVYYASLMGAQFDLIDLDRIEILRGPQGTLSGRNSIGGSIRLISKKPSGDTGGFVSGTYGSRNRVDLRASGDFVLVPDKLFARVSGVGRAQGGFVDVLDFQCANPTSTPALPSGNVDRDCKIGEQGGRTYVGGRAMLRWIATDALEFNLAGDFSYEDSQGNPVILLRTNVAGKQDFGVPYDNRFLSPNNYTNYATYSIRDGVHPGYAGWSAEDRNKMRGWGVSLTGDWNLADSLALKSITAFRGFKSSWGGDPDVSPLSLILEAGQLNHRQFSQELRLSGQAFGDMVDYTVGGYYFDQTTTYINRVSFPYIGVPGYDFLGNDPVDSNSKAVFGHLEFHATDSLSFVGGLRWTKEKKTYNYTRTDPDGGYNSAVGGLNGLSGTYEGDRVDYRIGVNYKVTDDVMVYLQRATGFKGGGVNPRPYLPSQVVPFNPETVAANEIGIKSSFFDNRVRLNLAAFDSRYKDMQIMLVTCPQFNPPGFPESFPCAAPQNAGDATIRGVEVELEARPVEGLMIDAALSHIDAHYTRIDPLAGGPGNPTGPQVGQVLSNIPRWKASGGIQYEFAVGEGSLTPRFDASYQSEVWMGSNRTNDRTRIKGYTLANGRLTYRSPDRDWEASVEVTNIFNKFYYTTIVDPGSFTWAAPSRPREWAFTVRKTF